MSSLEEEERLVQMVHDFIESSESSSSSSPSSSKCLLSLQHHHQPSYFLTLQEILRSGNTEAEKEVLERVKKHLVMRSRRDGVLLKSSNGLKKWLVRKLKMDGFNASLCHTSWATSSGCPAGDYEYIDIMVEDEQTEEPIRLIVDIDFKSQFELARPTQAYKELTNILPSIFVGQEEKLNKIISLLCSAAKQSLKERGLHIPPWRTSTYMHSKWLSAGCQKCSENIESAFGRKNIEEENRRASVGNVAISMVKNPKRSAFGGGSASAAGAGPGCSGLSSQFSNMGINCC
ncbi:hypothetical protein WN944_023286 [Citrus x changshan-huyou]|uniref:Uncharacterized protein n=1 Tax=Citrus x changshan-huyou TaxID=2935761 RepID=A0AAP0N5F8_9ROSI